MDVIGMDNTVGGAVGDKYWGIDIGDSILVIHEILAIWILLRLQHKHILIIAIQNSIPTKVFFTTGPVDDDMILSC